MKKLLAVLAASAVLPAAAQVGEVAGGVLVAGAGDYLDTGAGFYVHGTARPAPEIGFRGGLVVWGAEADDTAFLPQDYTVAGITGSLVLYAEPTDALRLRAGGGVGAYTFDSDEWGDEGPRPYRDPFAWSELDDAVGYHVLAGADLIIMGPVAFYAEGQYLFLQTDLTEQGGIVYEGWEEPTAAMQEVKLDGVHVLLGLRASF
jgi:hypothetical protein